MGWGSRLLWSALLIPILLSSRLQAQSGNQLGKIVGIVRVSRSDFPDHPVMVTLEMRGAPIASTYADEEGRVGFYNLVANSYTVSVDDDAYEPFSQTTDLNPETSPVDFMQIILTPRPGAKKDPLPGRVGGSNPFLVDPADYYRRFPKKTVKEFAKGVGADHKGNADQAIRHYLKALEYSPDFYPAHNNLGAIYVSRRSFEDARTQFEAALKSNQNDGQAYFNLANVLMLTEHYDDAEREIDEGLRRRPDSAFGKFLQGAIYTRTGQPDLAEKSLQSALQLDPRMSQAHLQLVNLYLREKRNTDAIAQLEIYLKAFPDSPFSPKARDLLKQLQTAASAATK